mgnify:CR=1 FL=1
MINPDEVILGIDAGETNIGLAFGRNGLVSPLNSVNGKHLNTAINEIMKTVYYLKANKIVVGLPLSVEGKETNQSKKIRQFVNTLKISFKRPIEFVSEYETSQEAAKELIVAGASKKRRRSADNISAAVILKRYYTSVSV